MKNNTKQFKMSNEQRVSDISVASLKAIIKECNEEILGRLSTLSEEVEQLKMANDGLVHEMNLLKDENNMLKRRLNDLETNIKGKNLVFRGLSIQQTNVFEIQKLCQEVLRTPNNIRAKSARTLYQRNGIAAVLVQFETENEVEDILHRTNFLKGTQIYIERDLNAERRLDKIVMLQLRRKLMDFSKKYKIKVRDDKLKIENKWFKWNSEKKLVCGMTSAINIFKELYGEDFNLNVKYNILKNDLNLKN